MREPAFMIAAPGSGSGKTLITCGVISLLKRKGYRPRAFKCGPDYIDPMFHKKALGIPSRNLDTFFTGKDMTRALYQQPEGDYIHDISVVEGVMGLYDGLGGVREEGSSYDLAEKLRIPVILVVDAHGMSRSIIPLVSGFLRYDREHLIKGVFFNRMSEKVYNIISPLVSSELGISSIGYLPTCKELRFDSRHLGLKSPEEIADIEENFDILAQMLDKTLDMSELLRIADTAETLPKYNYQVEDISGGNKVKIGVARDEAFSFFYEDNIRALQAAGAEIVPFSPIHDDILPEGISGLIFYGGYPELYLKELSRNLNMINSIRGAVRNGMPVIAECGGFMYLHDEVADDKGAVYKLCGIVHGKCENMRRLVRFGYVNIEEKENRFLGRGEVIRGHEFHYYDSTDNGFSCIVSKPVSKSCWDGIKAGPVSWLGFPHIYYPSNLNYVYHFVSEALDYGRRLS
ncbi:MAG: cobyrinate a,c-diamide synthase [Eubacterium sp.]|nr:cobyrinate a,c-diamide synthase [Eubacterium sp.]